MNPLPALRAVDMFPVEHEGQSYICLTDPSGIVEAPLVLSIPAALVAAQLDGNATLDDVAKTIRDATGGQAVSPSEISSLVIQLDTAGYLQTETYSHIENQIAAEFRARPVRPAYCAGKSYPDDPQALRAFIDLQYQHTKGIGAVPAPAASNGRPVAGIIAPHIDFQRGGPAYAHAYTAMAKSGRPDTVLIFGVAHAAEPVPFILTRKAFETPLGTLQPDLDFIDALETHCDFDPYACELAHRAEHSIEFQAVMLAHLYGSDVKIVPILTSYFVDDEDPGTLADGPVGRFLQACQDQIRDPARRVSVVAGADLAHVGRRFGDDLDIDASILDAVMSADQDSFHALESGGGPDFYRNVTSDGNSRNVCGYKAIYSTMEALGDRAAKPEVLHHSYAEDPAGGIVTFAALEIPEIPA